MTAPATNITQYSDVLLEQCRSSKAAVESAWKAHYESVMRYKSSKAWQANYATFGECCKANKEHFYAESSYRNMRMDIIVAEIIEAVADVAIDKTDARNLREKFYAVVPAEDRILIPSIWQLCHSYDSETLVPRKDVIAEAYEIIKEERDNHSISVNGLSVDIKTLAQNERIKEKVYQGIQAHSKRQTVLIEETRHIAMLARFLQRLGYNVGQGKKKLFIGYEGE